MKTTQPSLLGSLLLSASHGVRRLLSIRIARRNSLVGAYVQVLVCRARRGDEVLLDALIEPATPNAAWQPGDLMLLPSAAADEDSDELCRVLSAEVLEDRRFRPAADLVCIGTRRVRLSLQVRPGLQQLCFRHGSALFGNVLLPEAALLAA